MQSGMISLFALSVGVLAGLAQRYCWLYTALITIGNQSKRRKKTIGMVVGVIVSVISILLFDCASGSVVEKISPYGRKGILAAVTIFYLLKEKKENAFFATSIPYFPLLQSELLYIVIFVMEGILCKLGYLWVYLTVFSHGTIIENMEIKRILPLIGVFGAIGMILQMGKRCKRKENIILSAKRYGSVQMIQGLILFLGIFVG